VRDAILARLEAIEAARRAGADPRDLAERDFNQTVHPEEGP
jgi:hypothetical protein